MSAIRCINLIKSNGKYIKNCAKVFIENRNKNALRLTVNQIHTTSRNNDLMEFFEEEKNWGEKEVLVGRSWKKEDLRIKSNSDLHKLWFVFLKERNMLLTMKHEYDEKHIAFPNPERIDKMDESMENLEEVVRERNRAYYELEVGGNGERPVVTETNCFGLPYQYKMTQHYLPRKFNRTFNKKYRLYNTISNQKDVDWFLMRYRENESNKKTRKRIIDFKEVCALLKRFPNMDMEALKEQYPEVDIEHAKDHKLSRGNHENFN